MLEQRHPRSPFACPRVPCEGKHSDRWMATRARTRERSTHLGSDELQTGHLALLLLSQQREHLRVSILQVTLRVHGDD